MQWLKNSAKIPRHALSLLHKAQCDLNLAKPINTSIIQTTELNQPKI